MQKESFFSLLSLLIATYNIAFFAGFISVEFVNHGLNENYVGFVLGAMNLVYMVFCLVYPYCCEKWPRKFQFVWCFFLYAVSFVLMGPSEFLKLPDELWIIVSSMVALGVAMPYIFIGVIPEMIERMRVAHNIVEGQDQLVENSLNDKVNDAYGTIYALGTFLSPILGGLQYTKFGMRKTCDIAVYLNLGCMLAFFIFNCGFYFFKENRNFNDKLFSLLKPVNVQKSLKMSKLYFSTAARFHPVGQQSMRAKEMDLVVVKKAIEAKFLTP